MASRGGTEHLALALHSQAPDTNTYHYPFYVRPLLRVFREYLCVCVLTGDLFQS